MNMGEHAHHYDVGVYETVTTSDHTCTREAIPLSSYYGSNVVYLSYDKSGIKETPMRRLVQVVCWDTDKRVKANKALIYRSEPFLTDASDADVLMEYVGEIQEALGFHNDYGRCKIVDKEASKGAAQTVYLDPLELADVVKKVVTIA